MFAVNPPNGSTWCNHQWGKWVVAWDSHVQAYHVQWLQHATVATVVHKYHI